jgi:hypothetical protein
MMDGFIEGVLEGDLLLVEVLDWELFDGSEEAELLVLDEGEFDIHDGN